MSLEKLLNRGVLVVNPPEDHPDQRTIIVLGAPRGGTTMVAGALHHLGVPMGDTAGPTVFEDANLGKTFDAGDDGEFGRLVEEMNIKYDVWGWKRPTSYRRIDQLDHHFRAPYFVAVFRDPVSVGLREKISMRFDALKVIEQTLDAYRSIVSFMRSVERPFLAVSFDKALRYPEHFISELADFIGITDRPQEPAVDFIDPEPEFYLSRSHRRKDV